jgi:hypothetical protein
MRLIELDECGGENLRGLCRQRTFRRQRQRQRRRRGRHITGDKRSIPAMILEIGY